MIFKEKICVLCNKKITTRKHNTAEGWLCDLCYLDIGYQFRDINLVNKTNNEIRNDYEENQSFKKIINIKLENCRNFNTTRKISLLELDEVKKQWRVSNSIDIYNFEDILEFELIQDGETITSGGLGRAIVGGALFGGIGAIVGGISGSKNSKSIVSNLKIKVTINNLETRPVYLSYIEDFLVEKDSWIYKKHIEEAHQVLSILSIITKQNEVMTKQSFETTSTADEIMKFKTLFDQGVITQEQFELKKTQLLNL